MKTPRNWTKHDDMAAHLGGVIIKIVIVLAFLIFIIA